MQYINITRTEAERMDAEIAVLPLGSFEQHGPHLPLGTDIYITEALSDGIAERLGAFLLPVQPISTCYEHHGKKGSVHFSSDIFYRFIVCIIEALYRKGFKKIVVLPGHGGIFILEPAVRYLNAAHPGLTVIIVDPCGISGLPHPFETNGLHAGETETSLMLHIKPELVDITAAVGFIPEKPRPFLNYGSIFTLSASGVWGDATLAKSESGKWLLKNAVDAAVKKINGLFAELAGNDCADRHNGTDGESCTPEK